MALQLPIGSEEKFAGIIDLVQMKAIWEDESLGAKFRVEAIPESMIAEASAIPRRPFGSRGRLLMKASWRNISRERRSAKASPPTSATPPLPSRSSRFCAALLSETKVFSRCSMPWWTTFLRLWTPPVKGINPNSGGERPAKDDAPFSALAFKIMTDPFVGTLSFFRVYSGSLTSGASIYNSTKSKRERIGRLLKMHANKREEIKEVYAGDIAAAVGLRTATTGDTLCDESHPIILESIDFPIRLSLLRSSPSKADQERWVCRWQKLATEDPL